MNYLVYHYISLYCIALLCTALCCIVYHYIILHGRMHSISFSCLVVSIIVQHSKCTVLTQYGQRSIFLHVLNSVLSWVCVSQSSAVGYRQSHLMGCQVLWRSTAIKNNQMYTKSDRTLYVCIIYFCSQFHKRFNFHFHLHIHFHFHSYFSSFLHYLIIRILILIFNLIFNYMSSIKTKDDNGCRIIEKYLEAQDIKWTSFRPQYIYGECQWSRVVRWYEAIWFDYSTIGETTNNNGNSSTVRGASKLHTVYCSRIKRAFTFLS